MDAPLFDTLKGRVRRHRHADPGVPLPYTIHLEIAVRLTTGAASINHFSARPDAYPFTSIPSISETLTALRGCEPLVAAAPVQDYNSGEPIDYQRYEHWQMLADIWLSSVDVPVNSHADLRPLQKLLCLTNDIEQLNLPAMLKDGEILSRKESALNAPTEGWILSLWLFAQEGSCIEHWMRLEKAATAFGYGEGASNYYRSACRESVNHSWHPAAAIALGVYDLPVGTPGFFQGGEPDSAFKARIERIWRYEEPEMFG